MGGGAGWILGRGRKAQVGKPGKIPCRPYHCSGHLVYLAIHLSRLTDIQCETKSRDSAGCSGVPLNGTGSHWSPACVARMAPCRSNYRVGQSHQCLVLAERRPSQPHMLLGKHPQTWPCNLHSHTALFPLHRLNAAHQEEGGERGPGAHPPKLPWVGQPGLMANDGSGPARLRSVPGARPPSHCSQ